MSLIVQKYGGTSVGNVDRIRHVARRVADTQRDGNRLVVVVSAMAGETNRLLDLARQVAREPAERETDALVASGEQVSAALLALALQDLGLRATSFLGHQVRISTDSAFGRARIQSIDKHRLLAALDQGQVAVVAGFQGVDRDDNITTLGRGGSDTTGVALAAALHADLCEIFTDVEGVFGADPRIVPHARKLDRISYDEMLELASLGAKVLQIRSVEFAKRYKVPVRVRSTFSDNPGTLVAEEDKPMEDILVSGITHDGDQAKITLLRVPDRPGLAARIFVPIDASADGTTDLTFTVPRSDYEKALALVQREEGEIGAHGVTTDTKVAKVSIVGLGMRSHAGVAARMFEVLAGEGINIQMISTSEIKISVVVDEPYAELAVRALHDTFITPGGEDSARPGAERR
jgi:aspartate kinase